MKIVGVTACISGVAHTYMAAETLTKLAKKTGFEIKVETQGALGIENVISEDDIQKADAAVIISDINIEGFARFETSRLVRCSVSYFLRNESQVLQALIRIRQAPPNTVITL